MKAETVPGSCPLCGGDTKGDDKYRFYCQKCNVLFSRSELKKAEKPVETTAETKRPAKELSKEQINLKCLVSSESNKYHKFGCRYIKQIAVENLFYFNTKAECEKAGYEPCICIKKKK